MKLYKRSDSSHWQYDFTVRGKRYRGSTHESNKTAANERMSELRIEAAKGALRPSARAPETLQELSVSFLKFVNGSKLEQKSKDYLVNGWRLLENAGVGGMRADSITAGLVNSLSFPGGPYNENCALKTLRRLLHWSQEEGHVVAMPEIVLEKEYGRELAFTSECERRILPFCSPLLRDMIMLLRDTGLRPKREAFRMRVEHIHWQDRVVFIPHSKTETGRRFVPLANRTFDMLWIRCRDRKEGWVFEADSSSGHIVTIDKQFRKARGNAGLNPKLVLYCCRHDFGTEMLKKTGNLALVMRLMGQKSTKAALGYQHPELELAREAINSLREPQEIRVQ